MGCTDSLSSLGSVTIALGALGFQGRAEEQTQVGQAKARLSGRDDVCLQVAEQQH